MGLYFVNSLILDIILKALKGLRPKCIFKNEDYFLVFAPFGLCLYKPYF